MAFKYSVVKNQVDKIVFITNEDSFLPCFKTKSISQFKDKFLQVVE